MTPLTPRFARAVMLSLAFTACVHTSPQPTAEYWVSSDSSLYSPVARFRVRSFVAANEISIVIDSGALAVVGEVVPDAPPIMSNLYMAAILAVPDSGSFAVVRAGRRRGSEDRRGWRPLSTSDSALVAAQLRYGERAPLPELRFRLRMSTAPAGPLWIVFHIFGNTVELSAPLVAGATPRRRDLPGAVQVYTCGDRDALGQLDAARATSLKRAYGIAC